ncbi:polysaccharide biosynthesis protein [Sphingomonas sp.]|uniref:lipopolysaccharide biosynthesis protein n=1 Tax=Sphingomonas sp. TaxID=28214 RepID=UPI001B0AAC20|nr:polysaccharide biosynthesis protein [Sphingomonas sp.]MBO9712272.1 polysaccharide biosynthesis protein [Sphingomonas sp.]
MNQVTRSDVARGAGLAGLARISVAIEALAQPWYIWLFGLGGYGVYVVLWGGVNFLSNLLDLSMTSALQRVVPQQGDDTRAHGAVKFALALSLGMTALAALAITLFAGPIASTISAAPEDAAQLPLAIAIFAWALPLWTFVEVATSAARARRAFGPEIRLRLFWEQIVRIVFAGLTFAIGLHHIGLVVAHLASLALTAALSLRLLGRYYDLGLLWRAPIDRALARNVAVTGLALLPSALSTRALIDAPPVVLNLAIPGGAGAAAAGLFEVGRKLSTVPYIVRQAFQYVLAPLSSAQARVDRQAIAALYHFASRVSTVLVVPLAGFMVFAGRDLLSVYRREALPALAILTILSAARAFEAIVGPASAIVEMIGHRGLPLLNSLISVALWIVLAALLVPSMGALGMAIAVAAGVVAPAWVATIELWISDGASPFDSRLVVGLGIALIGVAAMGLAVQALGGPLRFVVLVAIWWGTSWLAMRNGLTRADREGLGGFARRLKLI